MADTEQRKFVALGHAGSEHYAGIETFPGSLIHSVDYREPSPYRNRTNDAFTRCRLP